MIAAPQFQSNRSRVIMTRNLQVHPIIWPILVQIVTCLLASTAAQSLSNSSTLVNVENLGKSNYIIGIAQIGARESISSLCGRELSKFLESVENRDVWAIKLIDSFGHVPESFTWGNVFWFPNRELCYDLNNPYKISLADYVEKRYSLPDVMSARSPFPVMFRVIFYNFTSPMYIDFKLQIEHLIHVGLCYPASCSEDEIITYSNYYFGNKTFDGQTLLDISMREVEKGEKTKVPGFRWDILLNPGVLLFITILVSVLVFGLFAEIITRLKTHHSELKKAEIKPEKSAIEAFLLCFSLGENSEKMVKAEESKNFLPVIAGLRSIVCIWVTIFHVYYYSLFTIKNAPFVFAKLELMILQPIVQSCYYVDIFFVISAFLLVYNFLSNDSYIRTIRENQFFGNLKLFLKFLLHRYLRLMPVLIIAMVISEIVFEAVDNCSPFIMDEYNGLNCRKTWWWNLLLINNFLNLPEICISWSWYVGCEMQYFALFLLFLFIYIRDERLGKALFFGSAVFFMIISFLCQYFSGASFKHDVIFTTLRYLYLKPWVRINPYFGGALMGFLYHKTKTSGLQASRPALAVFWMIALIVYLFTIFMSFWKETPIWAVAAIMSIGKTIFGLIIGGVIFLCQHGYGGFFNTFMGNRVFLYMNKFCYSIYMLAPLTVGVMFGLRNEGTLFNELASGADFMAIILITFGGSHLSVLLLEIPFQRISNRFILNRK